MYHSSYAISIVVFSSESVDQSLTPCGTCGRTFMPETLVSKSGIYYVTVNKSFVALELNTCGFFSVE